MSDNPFAQSPSTYVVIIKTLYKYIDNFINFFEEFSETISYFEAQETNNIEIHEDDLWQINIYFNTKPDLQNLQQNINQICTSINITPIPFELEKVADLDWVSEVQKNFQPISAGKFFICTTDYNQEIPQNLIEIRINAGRAFGTGEHQSTANCLRAISSFTKSFNKALDLGCGSGILAIALKKIGCNNVFATDIDEQAVKVTIENYKLNNAAGILTDFCSGYSSKMLAENSPFDLIVANILAAPLIEMAKATYQHLAPGGIVILAGFLKNQQDRVYDAYNIEGFVKVREIVNDEWPALILTKN